MKRLYSEEWYDGYCAGLKAGLAQLRLGVSEHQTWAGLNNSEPVLADQPRLPGACSTAQEARTGVAASIDMLRAVLEHAIVSAR